jgi:large subunit ribosomal protein L17
MRKKISNRILGRSADERLHLMRLLTSSLLEHGAITTTEAKAKELRGHFEPLVTRAKQELTLANRRLLIAKLEHKADLPTLLEVAKRNEKRPGGYLRITKLPVKRSDAAHMAHIEIL